MLNKQVERMIERLGQAVPNAFRDHSPTHRNCFQVGGVSVQIAGDQSGDVNLVPSLIPFRISSDRCDITIQVERVDQLAPSVGHEIFNSGSVWRLYEAGTHLQFDFSTPVMGDAPYKRLTVDHRFRQASLLLSNGCVEANGNAEPLEYPLDELLIMHRLTQEPAIELHG